MWYKSALQDKGKQYFSLSGKYGSDSRKILVFWQDPLDILPCSQRDEANTVVFYMRSTDIGSNFGETASDEILTKTRCDNDYFKRPPPERSSLRKAYEERDVLPWDWVAVGETQQSEKCDSEKNCNRHGTCQTIPFTRQILCSCHHRYDGEHCEEYENTFNEDDISKLSQLESMFGQTVGIPDIVDIHFALQDLEASMQRGFHAVLDVVEYVEALTKYSEVLQKVDYISALYSKWRNGDITDMTFGKAMAGSIYKLDPLPYMIRQLKNAMIAGGKLDMYGQDIFNTYKKAYATKFRNACTKTYNDDIKNMMIQLAGLDLLMSEALFQYALISKRYSDISADDELVKFMEENLEASKKRLQQYDRYWRETSCGDSGTIIGSNIQCSPKNSYVDMAVSVTCNSTYVPSAPEMTCTKDDRGNGLHWYPVVICENYWGHWSSWTVCQRTCGGSCTQTRNRQRVPTGEKETQSTIKVLPSCPHYIYQNNRVRFESYRFRGQWLDCHEGYCRLAPEQSNGYGQVFCRYGQDVQIRTQQAIGIRYANCDSKSWVNMNTVNRKVGQPGECPNNHPDFLSRPKCPPDTARIYIEKNPANQELAYGDQVLVRFDYENLWMSADKFPLFDLPTTVVTGTTCPGNNADIDHGSCTQELWILHEAP